MIRFIIIILFIFILVASNDCCIHNRPNKEPKSIPFGPHTTVEYSIPDSTNVIIVIYDIYAQPVDTLINEKQAPGKYTIKWNVADSVSSGVYFYKLILEDTTFIKKMIMLR